EKETFQSEKTGMHLFFLLDRKKHKIWSSRNGTTQMYIEKNGKWKTVSNFIKTNTEIDGNGYYVYYTIPYKKHSKSLQIGLALSSHDDNGSFYTEYLTNMNESNADSWIKVVL